MPSKKFKKKFKENIKSLILGLFYIYPIYKKVHRYQNEALMKDYYLHHFFKDKALSSKEDMVVKPTRKQKIIASITSYGRRAESVYLTLESLAMQTLKPDKIVLWLSKDDFNKDNIPNMLKRMQKRGLEIGFCKDIGPYTKLIPALKKYPNDLILTFDDDVIYPEYVIENLYEAHKKEPNVIHSNVAHEMSVNKDGKLNPYNLWNKVKFSKTSSIIFPVGYSGVLYFPGCFNREVFNEKRFMELSPKNDDVWFKAMSLKNGVKCKASDNTKRSIKEFVDIENSQDTALWRRYGKMNDQQIKAVFDHYNLYKLLKD
ncbi:glycosyltransferase [Pseudomonadota bacterium]